MSSAPQAAVIVRGGVGGVRSLRTAAQVRGAGGAVRGGSPPRRVGRAREPRLPTILTVASRVCGGKTPVLPAQFLRCRDRGGLDAGAGSERPGQSSALGLSRDKVTASGLSLPSPSAGGPRGRFPAARADRPAGRALRGERQSPRGPGWPPKSAGTPSVARRGRSASRGRREVGRRDAPGLCPVAAWQSRAAVWPEAARGEALAR